MGRYAEDGIHGSVVQIIPEQFKYYSARIKYHRTDDLRDGVLPDNTHVLVQALWIADNDEMFKNQMIFSIATSSYIFPHSDLLLLSEIRKEVYMGEWKNYCNKPNN